MTRRFDNWDEVVAFACALPDVEMAPFYGTPCPKVNGKAFVSPGREEGSFHVMAPHEEKELLSKPTPAASGRRRTTKAGRASSCAMPRPLPTGSPTSSPAPGGPPQPRDRNNAA